MKIMKFLNDEEIEEEEQEEDIDIRIEVRGFEK